MYDGADFVVLGNPVVRSYLYGKAGHMQYANGLLIQWVSTQWDGSDRGYIEVYFPLEFSSTRYSIVGSVNKERRVTAACSFYKAASSFVRLYQYDKFSDVNSYSIIAIGHSII